MVICTRPWIILRWTLTNLAYTVFDILAAKIPWLTSASGFLQTEDLNWHTLQVKWIPFCHIDDVESNLCASYSIFNTKVKPLEITGSVRVWPQKDIITVKFFALNYSVKVATFKISIKLKESVFLIFWYLLVNTFAVRVHSWVITRDVLLFWVSWPKYLLKQSIIVVLASGVMLWKSKTIAVCAILKLLIGKSLVHLIWIIMSALLVNEHISQWTLRITRYGPKIINLHPVIHEVKVKWNGRIARLDLRLPSELHVRHHALTSFYQWQWRILQVSHRLNYYLLICFSIVTSINMIFTRMFYTKSTISFQHEKFFSSFQNFAKKSKLSRLVILGS